MIEKSSQANETEPCAVLGAGDLIAHLHRNADSYRIILFRFMQDGIPTHELRAADLADLVRLCQVLAFAVVDDGWIPLESQNDVKRLWSDLDELTRRWDGADA